MTRRNKHGNIRTKVDGITFMSKGEAMRYCDLKLMQKAGKISDLNLQVFFPIVVNDIKICTYIADFTYVEKGTLIVEDFKGYKTAIYKLKKKLFEAVYEQEILETTKDNITRRR